MLRFVRGVDYTDVLLSSPCPSFTIFYAGRYTAFNIKQGVIDDIISQFDKENQPFNSPALLKKTVANGVADTDKEAEAYEKKQRENAPVMNWKTPAAGTDNTPNNAPNSVAGFPAGAGNVFRRVQTRRQRLGKYQVANVAAAGLVCLPPHTLRYTIITAARPLPRLLVSKLPPRYATTGFNLQLPPDIPRPGSICNFRPVVPRPGTFRNCRPIVLRPGSKRIFFIKSNIFNHSLTFCLLFERRRYKNATCAAFRSPW